ncbi:AraC family transcriptional regulator [Paenibacillus sp. J5C_2022]|uniref:AraC family transcriptional regulator n=1 Tax=Paenibacillus sp. J5C2022 TaxID=2977129 RepID=UPI0021D119FB|nr:AraC family transcriptional regulator [Paenibacillus sp. J5C2022]MCU6707472.1 AraC family transcriptional regulator [Paenibacillus sp. J5C2022]
MINIHSANYDDRIPNWRTHPEVMTCHIFVLVQDGKVRYVLNGTEMIAERGDFLFIPQATLREGSNYADTLHQKHTLLFTAESGESGEQAIPYLNEGKALKVKISNFQYVHSRFRRMIDEWRGSKRYRKWVCEGIVQELIGLLGHALDNPELAPSRMIFAETINAYLLDHYREPIELERLASLIQRSPGYTTALFKEVYGQTPIRYMHHLRIMEACNLLSNSDMSVSVISQYLGYYDASYFFRMFKRITGMTPSDFIASGRHF